jgi:hypothetical protein
MSSSAKIKPLLPTILALTIGAVACGGSGGSSSAHGHGHPAFGGTGAGSKAVLAAYETTTKAKTAKVSLSETVSQKHGGSRLNAHVTGHGLVDFASKAEQFGITVPSGPKVHLRKAGSALYVKVPAQQRSKVPGHKSWLKIDVNKLTEKQYGATLAQLHAGNQNSPTKILGYLRGASSGVHKAGSATIRGTKTTRYKVRVNLDKAAARKGPHARQATKKLEQQIGTHTLPMQLWLDHQGRVRQLKMSLPIPASSAASRGAKAVATVDFYDYGVPVHISAPPASQTLDITNRVLRRLPSSNKPSASPSPSAA